MKLLVITSFPERSTTHSEKTVGVASYTKALLTAMKREQPENEITVFAETFKKGSLLSSQSSLRGESPTDAYEENGITISRSWQRNNLSSLFSLLVTLLKRPEKDLLVSFEVYMFGSPLVNFIALIGLCVLRLFGKHITTVVHQVLGNPKELEKNAGKAFMLTIMKTILYRLLLLASTHVVVFEEQLKKQLPTSTKVVVIPHLISQTEKVAKDKARKELGLLQDEFYVLYFGYLSPYKGLEELIENWQSRSEDSPRNLQRTRGETSPAVRDDSSERGVSPESSTHLIIAGGPNPNHKTNSSYMNYVQTLERQMKGKNILATGFVPEEKVPLYFSASDVLVLPYTTFMSSSGPLSLAFSYELPVLLSEELAPYAKTQDIKDALQKADLALSDITFSRISRESLTKKLAFTNKNYTKLATFSRIIKSARSESTIAHKFWEVLK
ncbi:hypothetical protein BH09PAT1_BH09PAT1_4130 [soil metagenome]